MIEIANSEPRQLWSGAWVATKAHKPRAGSAQFDPGASEYRVSGGGANIWGTADAFHYIWKRVSGDITFTADVRFLGAGAVAHRKAALMIRQSLDPGAVYADVAEHGDGLTSLQFRPPAGAITQEIKSTRKGPVRIRIERRGDRFNVFAGDPGQPLDHTGPALVVLQDPVYVGEPATSISGAFPPMAPRPADQKAERVSIVEWNDWFPHPSPDGKWIVFVSFAKGTRGHPANQEVQLRLMPMPGPSLDRRTCEFLGPGLATVCLCQLRDRDPLIPGLS